MAVDN